MNPNGFGDRLLQLLTLRGPLSLGPVWRYGLAVVIAVVAAALGRLLSPGLGATCSYNLTLVGVVVATALLGTGPGIVAVILGVLWPEVFVMDAMPMASGGATLLRLGVAVATGASVVGLFHWFQVVQARLVKSQGRLAALAAATFEGIVESEGGRIVDCNEQFARMMGRTVAELKGVTLAELIPPEERERVLANIEANRESAIEHAMLGADGARLMVEARGRPLLPGRGHRQTAVRDITKRKLAEAARRESESTLRSFYESAPLLMGVVEVPADDLDIIHIYDNPETERFFGLPRGSTVGQSALSMGAPEDAVRRWIEQYRLAEREGKPVQFEYWHPRQSGAVWLSAAVARIGPGGSGRTRFSYVVADETERKQVEVALRESEEQFRATFNVSSVGKAQADLASGRFLRVNAAFCRMTGYTEAELLTRTVADLWPPEAREKDWAGYRRMAGGQDSGYESEKRYVRRDGRVIWVHVSANVIRDAAGRPSRAAAVIQDITERKAFQAELERLVAERTAKLEEMVGELEHFSYSITHDLKAPLRAMRGFAEIASGDCTRKEAKEALGRISTSAERMEGLITDTLNYSRSLRQELPLTGVDTGALLRGMLESYPELQPSRAHIQMEGELPVVVGNEAGLTQCFSNLLGNAVKFVRPGEKPQIRVWAEERDGWDRVWVEDKGIGISKEMLPRVFHMFSRASKGYEGTGIGLALVRKVTERMGGRVGVESEEGKGSRFWIELKPGEVRAKPERVKIAPAEPKGGTVLYVEDEEDDALFMKRAFAGQELESALRVVGDGRTAIDYLSGAGKYADRKEYPLPVVVVLDLNLPQLPGFEVLKWMRNHPDFVRTPVVVFSSSTREDDRLKAAELGANEFVAKPSSGLKFGEVVEGLRERWMGAAVAGGRERLEAT